MFEGRQFSRYRILKQLGAGGMGVVYEAEDLTLGRHVALKFLPSGLKQNPQAAERLKMEARSASALNHPNICTIYEVAQEDGELFIAMELLQGETLEAHLHRHELTAAQIIDIAIGIADGLDAAHAKGIVHRDIKPANVFMTARDIPKILDFGLAKAGAARVSPGLTDGVTREATVAHLTSPGTTLGTVAFMSPEQARGEEVDARSDLFSLGGVLYQIATHRLPFEGETSAVIFDGILNRDPVPSIERNPALPQRLHEIIHTALEKERDLRYQSAADIRAELKRLKRGTGPARASARMESGLAGEPAPSSQRIAAAGDSVTAGTARRRPVVWAGVAVAAVAVVAALGLWRLRHTAPEAASPFDVSSLVMTRVTETGRALTVAVSPDGRYVTYVRGDGEQQSLWVRQVATQSDVQVLPPDAVNYQGVAFSRDGNYIFFTRSDRTTFNYSYLYSVPVLGGTPRQLVRDIDSAVTFSPDGKQMAFVRGVVDAGKLRLMIANSDGTAEKMLWEVVAEVTSRTIVTPDWSPDGQSIAMAWGDRTAISTGSLTIVNVTDGSAKTLYHHDGRIGRALWRPGGAGLFIPLDNRLGDRAQLYYITYPDGQVRRFTNDLSDYSRQYFDMTADGKVLAIIEEVRDSDLELLDAGKTEPRALTTGGKASAVAWGPNDRLYLSIPPHIYALNANGGELQQLTAGGTLNEAPSACGDGTVFYETHSGDNTSIWRMDADGGNARRVIDGGGPVSPSCAPDSRWIIYERLGGGSGATMRAQVDGSSPTEILTNSTSNAPKISPDGTMIAGLVWEPGLTSPRLHVVPAAGGKPLHVLAIPPGAGGSFGWSPGGKAVQFALTRRGAGNLWEQALAGGPPRQVTNFKDKNIRGFAWSRDGKGLAVIRGAIRTDVILLRNFN